MSTAGIAAPEMRVPLKNAFLHNGRSIGSLKTCWGGGGALDDSFFSMDPVTVTYDLSSSAQDHLTSIGHISSPQPARSPSGAQNCSRVLPLKCSPEDSLLPGFSGLAVGGGSCASDEAPPHTPVKSGLPAFPPAERSTRPLPPLPIAEDILHDDADKEVEFLTSSDTALLLSDAGAPGALKGPIQGRRSFRDCGQVNYAYFEAPAGPPPEEPSSAASACPPPPPPLHRRLRRSHSGPAGSFNKPVVRVQSRFHRASPSSDDDKPEVPPRAPIPPRALKPDYRRWSAEVASNAYSDEDKPPKVPPREPLSRSNSRTPSPKSLPAYLNGVMPPTQSFAPDPKYVSSKALQRQHSEGSGHRVPCILPIIENGRKVSSTHYYLLPERPPYLDKYEKFFREAEEAGLAVDGQLWGDEAAPSAKAGVAAPVKRKHLPCMVSP